MKSIRVAAERLAKRSRTTRDAQFCSKIVSIEFNAWHYADTNLWASLVSYILEQLAAVVTPGPTADQQESALLTELKSAKAVLSETEAEKTRTQALITERQKCLQQLQVERHQKEVELGDLQRSDLRTLLLSDSELKKEINAALEQIGAPAALGSISDLSRVLSDAYTLGGRAAALLVEVVRPRNRWFRLAILLLLIGFPLGAAIVYRYFSNKLVLISSMVSEFVLVMGALTTFLGKIVDQVRSNFTRVEAAKQKIDDLIIEKRKDPSQKEKDLEAEVALLRTKEEEASFNELIRSSNCTIRFVAAVKREVSVVIDVLQAVHRGVRDSLVP
jgi:hypothetical protein